MDEGRQRSQWVHTSHQIWAEFVAAGATDVSPLDFNPYYDKPKSVAVELDRDGWDALGKGMVKAGLPLSIG